jgi:hypothetical protein
MNWLLGEEFGGVPMTSLCLPVSTGTVLLVWQFRSGRTDFLFFLTFRINNLVAKAAVLKT